MMDIREAIVCRHSVRQYDISLPLTPGEVSLLRCGIEKANREAGLRFSLVTDEPHAFGDSLMARYGKFSGVRNYICVIAPDSRAGAVDAGRHGQRIVLEARAAGLDSCWVGLSFHKKSVSADIPEGFRLMALISIGHGLDHGKARHSRTPQDISPDYDTAPEWFRRGIDSVMYAPSALNSQQVRFRYSGDCRVCTQRRFSLLAGGYYHIDKGIAMTHFELACPEIKVEWV